MLIRAGATARIDASRRDLHIFEIAGLVVDADARRGDPAGELARLGDPLHQADDEIAVGLRRQPLAEIAAPGGAVEDFARGRNLDVLELADLAMEADMRQRELEGDAGPV